MGSKNGAWGSELVCTSRFLPQKSPMNFVALRVSPAGAGTLRSLWWKAETNLRLQKNSEGITTMFSPASRNNSFGKSDGFCFRWCDEAKMHVSCGPAAAINEKAELNKQRREAADAFSRAPDGAKSMRYTELVDCTKKALGLKDRSAKDRIKGWRESGTVKEGENGSLEINGAEVQNGANP